MTAADWEKLYAAKLDNPALKKGLRLFYFATGKDDFLVSTTKATVDLFKKHGFSPVYEEHGGRPHLDQLARLPRGLRAAAVPAREVDRTALSEDAFMMRQLAARRLAAILLAVTLAVSLGLTLSATGSSPQRAQKPQPPPPSKVDSLVAAMTLEEKISMIHGWPDPEGLGQAGYIPGVPRLGVPPLRLSDGPAGIRTARPATALPAPVSMASTFSPDLAKQYGQIIGRDARARRQNIVLAPMVNIVRVPQGGRNFETLGEDPLLASRLVAAEIQGMQGEGVIAHREALRLQQPGERADVGQRRGRRADRDARSSCRRTRPRCARASDR